MAGARTPEAGSRMPDGGMLDYSPTSFSQGRMDFNWEELSDEERARAYADWEAGRGLIGGNPHNRPGSHLLPVWGRDRFFFRTLALDDPAGSNGARLRAALAGDAPLEIEIGYGRGDFLLERAARYADRLFVGYETKTKATRLALDRVDRFGLGNLWLSDDDARFSLPRVIPAGRASAVHILFPDPWWKKEHKVKRLFSPPFVDLLAATLASGGLLHFKSDVQEYGELVRYLIEQHGAFLPHDPALAQALDDRTPTHREQWCMRHGKPVWADFYQRR